MQNQFMSQYGASSLQATSYFCDAQHSNIWARWCWAISCPKDAIENTGNSLHEDPSEKKRFQLVYKDTKHAWYLILMFWCV